MATSPPALPFLNKETFKEAIDHYILHLQTYSSLEYAIKHSPFDESDMYLDIKKYISAPIDAESDLDVNSSVESNTESESKIALDTEFEIDIEGEEDDNEVHLEDGFSLEGTGEKIFTHLVRYEILLSAVYSVPVLHFNLSKIPNSTSPASAGDATPIYKLSEVQKVLVPVASKIHASSELLNTGIQGGISQTHHPYTNLPIWFIHPCNTADALRQWGGDLSLENFINIWIGMFGAIVSLETPIAKSS